jgi:hypothetical protein
VIPGILEVLHDEAPACARVMGLDGGCQPIESTIEATGIGTDFGDA